eukprot:5801638-Amphidinium_carterae.2
MFWRKSQRFRKLVANCWRRLLHALTFITLLCCLMVFCRMMGCIDTHHPLQAPRQDETFSRWLANCSLAIRLRRDHTSKFYIR